MGKKSRMKRERRIARIQAEDSKKLLDVLGFQGSINYEPEEDSMFNKHLDAIRALLSKYKPLDVAIALNVSELWPANVGSPIKHIFAWNVLLDHTPDDQDGLEITNYADFKEFIEALYDAWPDFPMLEDFSPEGDWGQTKVRLDQNFVPIFYGSSIERIPDFIEAFRITFAHSLDALAHMDLVIALQSQIIKAIPDLSTTLIQESQPAYVELPPEDFWQTCRSALLKVGTDLGEWREMAGQDLDASLGEINVSLTSDAFGDAAIQGMALPFLGVIIDNIWVPMSVRNAPGVVIDHWANKERARVSAHTHRSLAQFISERFEGAVMGPMKLLLGDAICKDLIFSSLISANSGVYLICSCDHASVESLSIAVERVYAEVRKGAPIHFLFEDLNVLMLSKDGNDGPSADELKIIIVVNQSNTAFSHVIAPKKPIRLLPLGDFITIFDSLCDLDELERYWDYIDTQEQSIRFFPTGHSDLYAAFKDTYGVLVDGAISPSFIGLDPHWGTSWRFKALADFWSHAPKVFPDGSISWSLSSETKGVVGLQSRHHKALAYSTSVGYCTVQTLIELSEIPQLEDARMADLFAQLLADCTYRCNRILADTPLFQIPHILFNCISTPSYSIHEGETLTHIEEFAQIVNSVEKDPIHNGIFHLYVDSRAILAGLNEAKDGTFEIRCLLEVLEKCHAISGIEMPNGVKELLREKESDPARYHLKVVERTIDVPDYVDPVIPTPTFYKLARKHLAEKIMELGLSPGRYELADAKAKIDPASARLRLHIENRLISFDRHQLLQAFIEQHDACLITERTRIQRVSQSLAHDVEYDRLEAVEQARKEFGTAARHYRYLLEKTVSLQTTGTGAVGEEELRELVALVDWYMVLTGASDTLHNSLDVGGVEIGNSYIPEVFYSTRTDDQETEFAHEYAKSRLGYGTNSQDVVEGELEELLSSENLKKAFVADLGFELQTMLTVLAVLSQPQRHGINDELSLSYEATPDRIADVLTNSIEGLDFTEAKKIVAFLTLSEEGVLRLSGRNFDEGDVPYWEHNKRIHRYTIRPLVVDGTNLRWGAEMVNRSMYRWMSAVRDGSLPADFKWPNVQPVIRKVKENIEKRLELQTEEIFRRFTPFVERGIDFYRKFRSEGFEDVGDFDVFAYWPDLNLVVTVECKYNQPPYTIKDGRRLRDKIFGKTEDDRNGQLSRLLSRRQFLEQNRSKMLELLKWPVSEDKPLKNVELYVSREIFYWMIHPPYPVPTKFVRVDALDTWIKTELIT